MTKNDTNYVVGWMVLDQDIIKDMITQIEKQLPKHGYSGHFPFNVLQYGNKAISENNHFSEFFTYATYALKHESTEGLLYVTKDFGKPLRNDGILRSCVFSTGIYQNEQKDLSRPPWVIWEEHKHHRFNSCADAKGLFEFTTIGIWHDFHPPPWGGGNQFLLALRRGLTELGFKIIGKNDPDKPVQRIKKKSQALLANSVTFKGNTAILDELKEKRKLALVHRVDGPYYVARYERSLNFTKPGPLPTEDIKTKEINQNYACATIFQSKWSIDANIKIGLNLRNPVVIPNMIDENVFYPPKLPRQVHQDRKLRIVASSHSTGARKGFDTMMWLDENLDFGKYDFVYMGRYPDSFVPKHIKIMDEKDSNAVADFLRTADIYLASSRLEPASNAVSEALACGLPVLYQDGSSHRELVGNAGIAYSRPGPGLLQALEEVVENYDTYVKAIHVPTMNDIARQYLAIMRWCFYMKNTLLLPSKDI
uniref:Glycosyl transferase family 1 domain-containing protein n=2 Tax=Entomoneis paludosa TaxID=265537 RepID=A0A7S2YTR9_9STRA|eukprot:CAMPEP_0172448364 /NCGR_PEP_ID=MMETSP1065-20121228/7398_1 /TAXON_ID=265537 /ORGANISM="Amphiprora paludosa, Strain CCMP125" /LENGTH=478 /DNA_ID=CAMNT_0013199837 /DNA_START=107 /DNA_END=1543 /DNA_ORIENTATION=+